MYPEKHFNLKTYITAIEAIAQMTYQSLYIIDYQLKKFLYISDNQLFLCGETIEEVEAQGYAFY